MLKLVKSIVGTHNLNVSPKKIVSLPDSEWQNIGGGSEPVADGVNIVVKGANELYVTVKGTYNSYTGDTPRVCNVVNQKVEPLTLVNSTDLASVVGGSTEVVIQFCLNTAGNIVTWNNLDWQEQAPSVPIFEMSLYRPTADDDFVLNESARTTNSSGSVTDNRIKFNAQGANETTDWTMTFDMPTGTIILNKHPSWGYAVASVSAGKYADASNNPIYILSDLPGYSNGEDYYTELSTSDSTVTDGTIGMYVRGYTNSGMALSGLRKYVYIGTANYTTPGGNLTVDLQNDGFTELADYVQINEVQA